MNETINNWKHQVKIEKGLLHEMRGMQCQDFAEVKEENEKISIALVDGRGNTDYNAIAMKKITKTLNNFMLAHFEEIYRCGKENISYNLLLRISRVIDAMSEEYQVERKELSSTLLAFCVDEETERYCAIHLGDGVIAAQSLADEIQILSEPTNGEKLNETVLSTSEFARKYLKSYKGYIGDIEKIMLASDGVYNDSQDRKNISFYFRGNKKDDILDKKQDDQSMIILQRRRNV